MCTIFCASSGTQHHVSLQDLTAGNKEEPSKDIDMLSTGTQELGSTTSGENSRVLKLDLRRLFCRTSRLSVYPTLQGSRSNNVHHRNKHQQQLYGVVVQVLTYARHAFSETGTTQHVKHLSSQFD